MLDVSLRVFYLRCPTALLRSVLVSAVSWGDVVSVLLFETQVCWPCMCHITQVGLDPIVFLFGLQSAGIAGVATLPGCNVDLGVCRCDSVSLCFQLCFSAQEFFSQLYIFMWFWLWKAGCFSEHPVLFTVVMTTAMFSGGCGIPVLSCGWQQILHVQIRCRMLESIAFYAIIVLYTL